MIILGEFSWYKDCGLDDEKIKLIDKLTSRRGDSLVRSDLGYVSSRLETHEERRALARAATRVRSLVLRIRVGGDSELIAISEYWSAAYKRKALAPIFECIAGNPHVENLDVVHPLPPVPRRLLYAFPLQFKIPENLNFKLSMDCL